MAPDFEPDDDDRFDRPPPPQDRLWRHPSELASGPTAANSGPVTFVSRTHAGPRIWTVGVLSSLVGAAATLAVLAGIGTFEHEPPGTAVEQVQRELPNQPGASELEIAQQAIPTVAWVTATGSGAATGGSAVVIRTDGHMITTADAVDGADEISVTFSDGQTSAARLIGVDRSTDLAVIKTDRTGLTSAVIGQTSDLQLGEPAIAIACSPANPQAPLVSVGLVSGTSKHVLAGSSSLYGMIQTNVKFDNNHMATGAILIDSSGSVIGVVTGRETTNDVNVPIQFAIPIDFAKAIADELIATGRITKPWLGVEGTDLDTREREQLGRGGAKVTVVADASPAVGAGIKAGDVIVSVDGHPIDSMAALVVDLRSRKPDDVIALGFMSNGQLQVGMATLVDRNAPPPDSPTTDASTTNAAPSNTTP